MPLHGEFKECTQAVLETGRIQRGEWLAVIQPYCLVGLVDGEAGTFGFLKRQVVGE